MKKQISGECILSPNLFAKWADFHLFRCAYPRMKKACIYSAVTILGGALLLLGLNNGNGTLIICGIAVLLCLFVFTYSVKSVVKHQLASGISLLKDPYEFILAPTGLIVTVKHEDGDERVDFFYNELEKVYDCNGCFYAYVKKGSCFIIPIECLNATPDEARVFLSDKMGPLYIMCK